MVHNKRIEDQFLFFKVSKIWPDDKGDVDENNNFVSLGEYRWQK
jgi:hypothetical protein